MDSQEVSLPLIHNHLMMPWNDMRRGDCCGRFEAISDGYYCKSCDFFIHKKCGESSESIEHPSHPGHILRLQSVRCRACKLCGNLENLTYRCDICNFDMGLSCARFPPPEVLDVAKTHHHKLTLIKEPIWFDCDAKCGQMGFGFPYKCHECDLSFHVDCVWHPSYENQPLEVNHTHHSLHPLKLLTGYPPNYSDGKCRLCERMVDRKLFYHCSSCNFTLDMRCVLHPPPQSLLDLKAHDHQLTLLPRLRSFTCNACGLSGDRSPYICIQCDFMIHQECLGLPRIININRHEHRVSRTSVLGVVNSLCGVCHQKVDWTCGGYSCQRCPGYVVHAKCATRKDVWNEKELEGVPEETEDAKPYVIIDDNTIQHFSHKEHYLRLNVNGILHEENKRCNACTNLINLQSFYGCMDCGFFLHQSCADSPRKKCHALHNERLTLVTSEAGLFRCDACRKLSNGFRYQHGDKKFDVQCCSIFEPFFHPSHPHHSLYYTPENKSEICASCNNWSSPGLRCIEDDCSFFLGFECATLPQAVKHRVGEKDEYRCGICEKETDGNSLFYINKDHQASFHKECLIGDFIGLMPGTTVKYDEKSYEVVLNNNSMSRPICRDCELHCIPRIILKLLGTPDTYFCDLGCLHSFLYF